MDYLKEEFILKSKYKNIFYKIALCLLTIFFSFSIYIFESIAEPVNYDMARKASETFLTSPITAGLQKPALSSKISKVKFIESDDKKSLAYIIELEPEGFVILSGDTDIRPVVGYSYSGSFPYEESEQNVLLHLVKWDMEARLKNLVLGGSDVEILAESNNILWEEYISGNIVYKESAGEAETYGPLIETHWNQGSPYNDFCPIDPKTKEPCDVGCVAIATAQIANYWGVKGYQINTYFIDSYEEDAYVSEGENGNISIPEDLSISFTNINNALADVNYNGNYTEKAYICLGVGIKLETDYSSDGSCASTGSTVYKKLGYGSAIEGDWQEKSDIIDNIKEGWPVQISVTESINSLIGHSLIVDGFKESTGEFHVNMGWKELDDDIWYNFPDIVGDYQANYHVIRTVVYDICPYQAWVQVGGGATNRNNVPYYFPESAPEIKWTLTVPANNPDFSGYDFDHIIVGTGDKLYASISGPIINDNYPPYVCIINSYGYIEKPIKITESDEPIRCLSQNSKGEIFFGTENNLYKLNPYDDSVEKIYSPDLEGEIGGSENPNIKIDEEGNLYFVVTSAYSKFYCVSSNGTYLWSHTFSENENTGRSMAAIDDVRKNVYINYHNYEEKKSYVLCFNKLTGSIRWTHEFPEDEYAGGGVSPVSIGEDGTIYVGRYTKIYALLSTNGNTIWEKDFFPAYVYYVPTINCDCNTLYINNGKLIEGVWDPGYISALESSTGAIKWEFKISPSLSGIDKIGDDIYSDKNDMIIFSYNRGDNFYLAGVKDKGSYGEILWDVEYGGKIAFGSGEIYLTSGNSIYALSTGEKGNPDELAHGYVNNELPAQPSNPTPSDQVKEKQTDLTLSWSCSDPDGHSLKYDVFIGDVTELMIKEAEGITQTKYTPAGLQKGKTYVWKIVATDGQALTEGPTWSFTTEDPDSVFVDEELPREFALKQNYPNPFNPKTIISYEIPKSSYVTLSIYNIIGQEVKTLINQYVQTGRYSVIWNGIDNEGNTVTSGVYIYRIQAGDFTQSKKLILMR